MNTHSRILAAIAKFNNDCGGQANLGSIHAQEDLATMVYNAVMKQTDEQSTTATYNIQETFNFSNKDTD